LVLALVDSIVVLAGDIVVLPATVGFVVFAVATGFLAVGFVVFGVATGFLAVGFVVVFGVAIVVPVVDFVVLVPMVAVDLGSVVDEKAFSVWADKWGM
jgi:hypothetical protein